jgi:hypothetical protein
MQPTVTGRSVDQLVTFSDVGFTAEGLANDPRDMTFTPKFRNIV